MRSSAGNWSRSAAAAAAVATAAGLFAFFYPFVLPALVAAGARDGAPRSAEASILLAGVAAAAVAATVGGPGPGPGRVSSSRAVALLASLAALVALLRLVPSIGGASLMFAPIVIAGAAFGPGFGYLLGVAAMMLSAVLTGGIGPWLPYQALAAGWVGASAGLAVRLLGPRVGLRALAALAFGWGLVYGALLNLYAWPFLAPGGLDGGLYWSPDAGFAENLHRYADYYLVTSLPHDLMRAVANGVLVAALGRPMLRALRRAGSGGNWEDLGRERASPAASSLAWRAADTSVSPGPPGCKP
ncbi:MAG: ECF transporter S component [Chloroflexota bacterium]